MTGATEALLAPWLAPTATHLASSLRRGGSRSGSSELRRDDLMEDVEVGLNSKYFGVQLDVTAGGAICLEERSLDVNHEP